MKLLHSLSLLGLTLSLSLSACQSASLNTLTPQPIQASQTVTTLSVGKVPHGIAAAAGFVYNSNTGDKTLSVIDAKQNTVIKTLSFDKGGPSYLKATSDQQILVLNAESGQVHLLDPQQDHQLIHTWEVGMGPDKVQISADAQRAFVSLSGEPAIAEINLLDRQAAVIKHSVGAGSADGKGHRALVLGQQWLAIPNPGDNNLSLLNLASGQSQILNAGNEPATLAIASVDGQDQTLIIGNRASNTVTLYDFSSQQSTVLSEIGLSPTDMVWVPELQRVLITMAGSNEVAVIDTAKQRLIGKVAVGERPVHIYRAPSELSVKHEGHDHAMDIWVSNDAGASVSVIDAQTLAVLATHTVGKGHHKMAFAQNKVFVSNITDNTLTVVQR